jgi:pyridoxal phosphate enzyme (YggS family)
MRLFIEHNIANVRKRISDAEKKYHRQPNSVRLMAVSKTRSADMISAVVANGITDIGENYVQEALAKIQQLDPLEICWHFIGPIQANKTRSIAENFSWVHSVDRLKIAQRLNDQRPSHLPPLNICLQVNVSDEASKSGVPLDAVEALAATIAELPRLRLRCLMAVPKSTDDDEKQRNAFAMLANARNSIPHCDTLSMGMSGDLEAAIAEGSTMVRIGTDIFGPRN